MERYFVKMSEWIWKILIGLSGLALCVKAAIPLGDWFWEWAIANIIPAGLLVAIAIVGAIMQKSACKCKEEKKE